MDKTNNTTNQIVDYTNKVVQEIAPTSTTAPTAAYKPLVDHADTQAIKEEESGNLRMPNPIEYDTDKSKTLDQAEQNKYNAQAKNVAEANEQSIKTNARKPRIYTGVPTPDAAKAEMGKRVENYGAKMQEEAEKKKITDEEKREKMNRIIGAVGDGISALSDLYFAHKGATPIYTKTPSLVKGANDRWQRLVDNRLRQAYKKRAEDMDLYRWEREQKLKEREAERKGRQGDARNELLARKQWLAELLSEGKIDEQTYKAEEAKYDAEIARHEAENADTYYKNRASRVGQRSSGGGRGGSSKQPIIFMGKQYTNTQAYQNEVYRKAKDLNIATRVEGAEKGTTYSRNVHDIAAEVEAKLAKQ